MTVDKDALPVLGVIGLAEEAFQQELAYGVEFVSAYYLVAVLTPSLGNMTFHCCAASGYKMF